MTIPDTPLDRRRFLLLGAAAGGGLLVACSPIDPRERGHAPRPPQARGAGTAAADPGIAVNAWVRVHTDGRVQVALPRSEMGQGVHTALAMLVAEELEADWAQVQIEQAPPGRVYANTAMLAAALPLQPDDEGWLAQAGRWATARTAVALSLNITGGSTSVRAAWEPMRWAGASARAVLVATAARQWGVKAEACAAQQSAVVHAASGRRAGFGELARLWSDKPLDPPSSLQLKPRERWTLIGTSPTRLDTPAKSTGTATFGADIPLPGLRRAALRTCPWPQGHLARFDDTATRALSGVRDVWAFPDWPVPAVAVVADTTWQALRAAAALQIDWDAGLGGMTASGEGTGRAALQEALDGEEGTHFRRVGDADSRWQAADPKQRLEAVFEVPHLAHAPMEPLNATAWLHDDRLEIWTGTQSPILARWRASQITGLPIESVTLHIPFLGGGFGRRLEVDVVEQVTHLAMKMRGTPVHLTWTREQDLQHDVYRPAAMARLQARIDEGRLDTLRMKVSGPSVSDAFTRRLLPADLMAPMPVMPDKTQIEGAYDLPYAIGHLQAEQVLVPSPLPIGYWRGVGHSYNAFFTECFLDEVAQALGRDPLDLRLSLLSQRPRHRAVLEAAARRAGWPQASAPGRALGLALHESFGALCAQVAEVSLADGRPRVHRIVCALDAGTLVHPDTVRAQLESAIVFGLSAALWGRVPVQEGRVALRGWADYPVVRMADVPVIDTVLIESREPPGGVGEPGTPPVAPAVANALARLDGRRRRALPLSTA